MHGQYRSGNAQCHGFDSIQVLVYASSIKPLRRRKRQSERACPSMAIPVLILNLKSSTKRRAEIESRLARLGIEHRFYDAIDGRSLSPAELERLAPRSRRLYDRALMPKEIACTVDHFAMIRLLAGEDHEFACVMEDDAVMSAEICAFLDPQTLRSLPQFDVLRLHSDPARWKRPAWKVAEVHGRGIYAMARAGFGVQGQVFSRHGLHKMAAQLGPVMAPVDFVYYHDCHVRGLRILEVRPGVIEHDENYLHPELMAFSDIGVRPVPDVKAMSLIDRLRRNALRQRRKFMAARSFVQTWGLGGMVRVLSHWPPGGYFR
jgi:glycosyl transferase, family 25